MQVNVVGQIFDTSGYSLHTRNLANALNKIVPVRLSTNLVPGWERTVSDAELEMIKRPYDKEEINLLITHPLHWRMNCTQKRNWAFCIWEGDKVPSYFIEEFMNPEIEYIFVASTHTRDAIVRTLHETPMGWEKLISETFGLSIPKGSNSLINDIVIPKIKIMHHGVDLSLFYPKENPKGTFTFLGNKGFRNLEDRGGLQYLIQAYLLEFTDKDNVELVLKINPAYGIPDMNLLIAQLSNRTRDIPRIIIDTNAYEYKQLVDLYNKADVFVMPTRAEAFGIPGIESMACGIPIISSNFGGQTDYANEDNSWIIGGKLTEVKFDIMYEGISWLTPDIAELRKAMREAYSNPELLKQKGLKALETSKQFTWEKTANKIIALI